MSDEPSPPPENRLKLRLRTDKGSGAAPPKATDSPAPAGPVAPSVRPPVRPEAPPPVVPPAAPKETPAIGAPPAAPPSVRLRPRISIKPAEPEPAGESISLPEFPPVGSAASSVAIGAVGVPGEKVDVGLKLPARPPTAPLPPLAPPPSLGAHPPFGVPPLPVAPPPPAVAPLPAAHPPVRLAGEEKAESGIKVKLKPVSAGDSQAPLIFPEPADFPPPAPPGVRPAAAVPPLSGLQPGKPAPALPTLRPAGSEVPLPGPLPGKPMPALPTLRPAGSSPSYPGLPPGKSKPVLVPAPGTRSPLVPPLPKRGPLLAGLVVLLVVCGGSYYWFFLRVPPAAPVAVSRSVVPPAAARPPSTVPPAAHVVPGEAAPTHEAAAPVPTNPSAQGSQTPENTTPLAPPPSPDTPVPGPIVSPAAVPASLLPAPNPVSPPPSTQFHAFVDRLKIGGIRAGPPARLFVEGVTIRSGDLVDSGLGVVFVGIDSATNELIFKDSSGAVVRRHF